MIKGKKIENANDITIKISGGNQQFIRGVEGFEVVRGTSKSTGKEYTINKIFCDGVTVSVFSTVITKQIEELDDSIEANYKGDWILTSKQSSNGHIYTAMYKCKNDDIPF